MKDVFRQDARTRRLREVPPSVTLNVPNLQLSIPAIPAGLDAQAVQNYINTVVTQAVQAQVDATIKQIVDQLLKAMPEKGFQHIRYNATWQRDGSQD